MNAAAEVNALDLDMCRVVVVISFISSSKNVSETERDNICI